MLPNYIADFSSGLQMLFSMLLQQPQFPSLFLDPEEEQILATHPHLGLFKWKWPSYPLLLSAGPDPEEVLILIRGKDDSRFCLIKKTIHVTLYLQKLYFTYNYGMLNTELKHS